MIPSDQDPRAVARVVADGVLSSFMWQDICRGALVKELLSESTKLQEVNPFDLPNDDAPWVFGECEGTTL